MFTDHQYSRSSLLGFVKDWNLFSEFCQIKQVTPLPASTTAVRLYLEKAAQNKKYATIKRYTVTISLVHRILTLPDPTQNARVQTLLSSLRIKKKGDNKQTASFNREHLLKLSEILTSSDSLQDIRNLAIYFVMFDCLMKRKDLKNLTHEQLKLCSEPYSIVINESIYPLTEETQEHLNRWLKYASHQSEFVFTAIDKHGNVASEQMNDSSIFRILRKASKTLGLDIEFSGQSLRVGAVKELANQGLKPKDIQRLGRWLSPAMPYQYLGNATQAELEKMKFLSIKSID